MEITIELKKHCIETETKRVYERLISCYFQKSCSEQEKPVLETQIDGIRFFLENADFRDLRSRYDELSDNLKNRVILRIGEDRQKMEIACRGKAISVLFL